MKNKLLLCAIFLSAQIIHAQNATTAGQVTTPYPTVINMSIVWEISGDNNRNGKVEVEYRKVGDTQWLQAMDLRRVVGGSLSGRSWSNKHAGSLFDLQPGTEYEIHLTLTDPDGGSAEETVTESTRPVPRVPANAEIITLPAGYQGNLSTSSGTAERPKVYRSDGCKAIVGLVALSGRQHVIVEDLCLRGPNGEPSGGIGMSGAKNCVVRRCSIYSETGITANFPIENCYISDNVIYGPWEWIESNMRSGGSLGGGITITGPGNVICYNKVSNSSDLIGMWEGSIAQNQSHNDFYNNELCEGLDDAIEGDFAMVNCRFIRNRITNVAASGAISSQPSLGGPTYYIRNVIYNSIYSSFKLHIQSTGNVCLHNTVIKPGDGMNCMAADNFHHTIFRNNIAIGGPPSNCGHIIGCGGGAGAAMGGADGTGNSFDYDAVGSENGSGNGYIGSSNFLSREPNGIGGLRISSTFNNVSFPNPALDVWSPQDLRPKASSAVVDNAQLIPNINDNYLGSGPDRGAYEAGQDLPTYGPRPAGVDEQTPYDGTSVNPLVLSMNRGPSIMVSPNPFANGITIHSPIAANSGRATLAIFDIRGKKVKTLYSGKTLPEGNRFYWDGRGKNGAELSEGIYFVNLKTSSQVYSQRVMFVR